MPEDTNAGIIQAFLDDYDDDYVCTRILFDEALHRTGEMKQWEGKEIANIMNNAIVGWKPHGTHRFGKEYGIQRSWKRIEDFVKKDKGGSWKYRNSWKYHLSKDYCKRCKRNLEKKFKKLTFKVF